MNIIHTASAAIIGALVLTNCATSSRLEKLQALQRQTEYDRTETARMASASHRANELVAAATLAVITQKAQNEKADLQRRVAALTDSLRNRPDRPASGGDVPQSPANPMACTGAGLYREDGAFLVGESARADQLRADLAACQAAYDAAVTLTR